MEDFISSYLDYVSDTEPPVFFHRWCAITSLGAWLGRRYYLNHGHFRINPNIYTMLMGSPGTRKSTAIKLSRKLIALAGYETFSADKTSKEKFILDLSGEAPNEHSETNGNKYSQQQVDQFLASNLWGTDSDEISSRPDCETFICADEFNDFIGSGNMDFISLLGSFWDYEGIYTNRIKSGKSVSINNPTISILAGNTPKGFSLAFPTDILGQGFFSRLLLIHSEPSSRRITFPKQPDGRAREELITLLGRIKTTCIGAMAISKGAEKLLDKIYRADSTIFDVRFESYSTRRFSHLLKLSLILSASSGLRELTETTVRNAHTVLCHTEQFMPKALGEFGRARNSEVSHKVLQVIEAIYTPITFTEIWKHVSTDLEKMTDLATLLQNLVSAGKVQTAPNGLGFLPIRQVLEYKNSDTVDWNYLTTEEREMKK